MLKVVVLLFIAVGARSAATVRKTVAVEEIQHSISYSIGDSPSWLKTFDVAVEYRQLQKNLGIDSSGTAPTEDDLIRLLVDTYFPVVENNGDRLPLDVTGKVDGWQPLRLPSGESLLCSIPSPQSVVSPSSEPSWAQVVEEAQLAPGTRLPKDAAEKFHARMKGRCFNKADGWWTYAVCWGVHVTQFHVELINEKVSTTQHYLGKGPAMAIEDGAKWEDVFFGVDPVNGRYVSTTYTNGSMCEATKEERETEIRVSCDEVGLLSAADGDLGENAPDSNISPVLVHEPTNCKYLISIVSPVACVDQLRKPPPLKMNTQCHNVDRFVKG